MAVAAYGVASRLGDRAPTVPVYRATATLVVSRDGAYASPEGELPWDLDRLMSTYAQILRSEAVVDRAARELGEPEDSDAIRRAVTVSIPEYSQLLDVTVTDSSPARAERLAGAMVWAFAAVRDARDVPGVATVLDRSAAQRVASDETPMLLAAMIVALAGAAGAAALALAFECLSGALRDARDAELATGLKVLASMPAKARGAAVMQDGSAKGRVIAERYRMLRTAFGIATQREPAQVVLVTAPSAACGASTVAANFALAAAQGGRRVALVDANLRAPSLHHMFAVAPEAGLVEALSDDLPLDTAAMPSLPGIALIPAGGSAAQPSELLDSARFDRLLAELRERFDLIVLDSPPALAVTDAAVLASKADAAIVVVRADRTARRDAAECVETLRRAGSRVLGLVLTDDPYAHGVRAFGRRVRSARRTEPNAEAR
jgi:capsular exopolysaccharide synthesis family protein